MKGRGTLDQIFSIRIILERKRERNIDTHHLFADFQRAYGSIIQLYGNILWEWYQAKTGSSHANDN